MNRRFRGLGTLLDNWSRSSGQPGFPKLGGPKITNLGTGEQQLRYLVAELAKSLEADEHGIQSLGDFGYIFRRRQIRKLFFPRTLGPSIQRAEVTLMNCCRTLRV
jgi:hypothetical protein